MARKNRRLEGDIQKSVLETLKMLGIVAWRVNSGAARMVGKGGKVRPIRFVGISGHSDIQALLTTERVKNGKCVREGISVFVECKREGEKQNDDQIEFERIVTGAGAVYWVVHSAQELIEKLREAGYPC